MILKTLQVQWDSIYSLIVVIMVELSLVQKIILYAIPILFAITVHEVAHGWVASKLGDQTARMLGRLTLNPIKHIDPIGTILVPAILLWLGGFIFGWAKPVPVNWNNLGKPKRDMALVAAAGPGANLLMALIWALVAKISLAFATSPPQNWVQYVLVMAQAGILINFVLLVLNLFPIPPLDGSRVVSSFLSPKAAYAYNKVEPYGFFILLALLATGILGKILSPAVIYLYRAILGVFGIN